MTTGWVTDLWGALLREWDDAVTPFLCLGAGVCLFYIKILQLRIFFFGKISELFRKIWGWYSYIRSRSRTLKRKGIYVYLWLTRVVLWQKPTKHCKAIALHLKITNKKKKKKSFRLSRQWRWWDSWHPVGSSLFSSPIHFSHTINVVAQGHILQPWKDAI